MIESEKRQMLMKTYILNAKSLPSITEDLRQLNCTCSHSKCGVVSIALSEHLTVPKKEINDKVKLTHEEKLRLIEDEDARIFNVLKRAVDCYDPGASILSIQREKSRPREIVASLYRDGVNSKINESICDKRIKLSPPNLKIHTDFRLELRVKILKTDYVSFSCFNLPLEDIESPSLTHSQHLDCEDLSLKSWEVHYQIWLERFNRLRDKQKVIVTHHILADSMEQGEHPLLSDFPPFERMELKSFIEHYVQDA